MYTTMSFSEVLFVGKTRTYFAEATIDMQHLRSRTENDKKCEDIAIILVAKNDNVTHCSVL